MQHRQTAPQAAEGIEADAQGRDAHRGGIPGVGQQAGGAQLQAGPAQSLVGPQLQGVPQGRTQLALQPGLEVAVDPPRHLVEGHHPGHGNGCAAASQQPGDQGAGANGKAAGAWGAI